MAGGYDAGELSRDLVEEFLLWQRAGGRHRSEWSRPGLLCLLEVLRAFGVLAGGGPALAGSPTDLLLAFFEHYLASERERGLVAGSWLRPLRSGSQRFARVLDDGAEKTRAVQLVAAA